MLNLRPSFTITNAPRSGPAGAITYLIELADSDSFANKAATWSVPETPSQTITASPLDLGYGKVYYWHVRAYDPTTIGPWSNTQAFQMLVEPAPVPGPGELIDERGTPELLLLLREYGPAGQPRGLAGQGGGGDAVGGEVAEHARPVGYRNAAFAR